MQQSYKIQEGGLCTCAEGQPPHVSHMTNTRGRATFGWINGLAWCLYLERCDACYLRMSMCSAGRSICILIKSAWTLAPLLLGNAWKGSMSLHQFLTQNSRTLMTLHHGCYMQQAASLPLNWVAFCPQNVLLSLSVPHDVHCSSVLSTSFNSARSSLHASLGRSTPSGVFPGRGYTSWSLSKKTTWHIGWQSCLVVCFKRLRQLPTHWACSRQRERCARS